MGYNEADGTVATETPANCATSLLVTKYAMMVQKFNEEHEGEIKILETANTRNPLPMRIKSVLLRRPTAFRIF